MTIIIRANKTDKKSIVRFYKAQNYSASFMGYDSCYLLKQHEQIIASVIISQISPSNNQYLLHALVVDKKHQKQGLASQLLQHAIKHYSPLVCFAKNSLAKLYQAQGFQMIESELIHSKLTDQLASRFKGYQEKNRQLKVFILG